MLDKTIQFFKEISKIPRESGNEAKIAQYLCEFAQTRNLEYEKDEWNNVLIKKQTSICSPIILQAHIDMVCEKLPEKSFNFATNPIEIIQEKGYLKANGTTLGADNGIGVAQILTVLDSDMLCNIEALFTTSEETSMAGASNFDVTRLKGKQLLNLDGFEENTIIVESACFYDIILKGKNDLSNAGKGKCYEIILQGLPGGHSGFEINKNKQNSNIELAKILTNIEDCQLNNFIGGTKFNVIPSQASSIFYTEKTLKEIQKICEEAQQNLKKYCKETKIVIHKLEEEKKTIGKNKSKEFLKTILNFPHGVIYKNKNNEVTTSINLGVVDLQKNEIKVGMRSSKKQEEKQCLKIIEEYSKNNNLQFNILSSQPGFESNKNEDLIKNLLKAHPSTLFKKQAKLKSVHITVEVGFFQEKIPNLQIAIISPNIKGAHTVKECVEIASIERVNKWILNFLEECNRHKK